MASRRPPFDYAAQWDDVSRQEELTLPGGKKVLVEPPDLAALALEGKIPNHLIGPIERFVLGGMREILRVAPGLTAEAARENPEPGRLLKQQAELTGYMQVFACAACVSPRFSLQGAPGTLPVAVLSGDELFAIWDWGVGLTAALKSVRGDGAGAVGAVGPLPGGEGVRGAAEQPNRADAA